MPKDNKPNCVPDKGEVYSFFDLQGFLMMSDKGTYYTVQQINPELVAVMHIVRNDYKLDEYRRGDGILFYADGDICSADNTDSFRLIAIHHPTDVFK